MLINTPALALARSRQLTIPDLFYIPYIVINSNNVLNPPSDWLNMNWSLEHLFDRFPRHLGFIIQVTPPLLRQRSISMVHTDPDEKKTVSVFTQGCETVKPNRHNIRPRFFRSRICPVNDTRIRHISMVPCERKVESDEFVHGLQFERLRVNMQIFTV